MVESPLSCDNAGLVMSEEHGQFVVYRLVRAHLVNTPNDFVSNVRPLR
jgi:hypothetical protein